MINFAGTSITLQPTLRFSQVHLVIQELDGEKETFLLRPNGDHFEVLDETGQKRLRDLTELDFLEEIISKTKSQVIQ